MEASFLFCFLSLLIMSEAYQPGIFNNDYEPSIFSPLDSSPYNSFKEELLLDQVIEESSDFKIKAKNVKQWLRLSMDNLYLLGISEKEVSLVSMYNLQSNKYQAHEYPLALQYEVSCGVMFKSRHSNDDNFEGVVLLALKSPRPIVSVYKIKHFKLHHITNLDRDHSILAIKYFKWHHEDRFIIFEEHRNMSLATVYGFELVNHAPHFWHVETMPLGSTRGYPTLGHIGRDTLFLATMQGNATAVNIYSYKEVCVGVPANKFELVLTIPGLNAKKIEFFQAYGHLYFIVSGSPSVLYRITPDVYLIKDIIFGTSIEMMVIPVKSARHDTILLGKSMDGTPHVYTFIGNGMWEEKLLPQCRSSQHKNELVELKVCIGGTRSWEGATYIDNEGDQYPSILFAERYHSGEIYYLPFSIIKIPSIQQPVNPHLLDRLESYWNSLRTSLTRLIMARSQEGPSQSISSYCIIEKEVNDMHNLLSQIKMPLDWTDCTTSVFQTDVTFNENEQNIADEAKPIETITLPYKSSTDHNLKTYEDSLSKHVEPFSPYPITQSNNLKDEKTVPIAPEMNNDAWDNKGIFNERLDGFDEIYKSDRR